MLMKNFFKNMLLRTNLFTTIRNVSQEILELFPNPRFYSNNDFRAVTETWQRFFFIPQDNSNTDLLLNP